MLQKVMFDEMEPPEKADHLKVRILKNEETLR